MTATNETTPAGAQSDVDGSVRMQCPACRKVYWRNRASGRCYDITDAEIFRCISCGRDLTSHLDEVTEVGADDQTPDPWEVHFTEECAKCPCMYFGDEGPACLKTGKCEGWAPYPVAYGPAPVDPLDGCVRCAQPASLTIRIGSGDRVRVCRPCFDVHYEGNERSTFSWEVVES